METNRLKQFCAVVEYGSLTKASQMLRMTHSGLSKSLSVLERDLGVKLFYPEGRGLGVTSQGREIYKKAQTVLETLEILTSKANETEKIRPFRVAVFEIFTSHFFGNLAANFFKNVPLEVLEMGPGQMENAILEDRVDAGLSYLPRPQKGLEYLKICSIPHGVFVSNRRLSNRRVSDLPFVVPSVAAPQNPLGIKERDGWPEGVFPRKRMYQTNLLAIALDLARRGLCGVYIPEFLAMQHNRVVLPEFYLHQIKLPVDFPKLDRSAFLVKKAEREEDQRLKKLTLAVRTLCRK